MEPKPTRYGPEGPYSPYEDVFVPMKSEAQRAVDYYADKVKRAKEQEIAAIGKQEPWNIHVSEDIRNTRTHTEEQIDRAIKFVTDNPHPLSRRFHELLREAGRLHNEKQADYGTTADPFANVRASQDWGIPGWVGCMVRATDKVKRLQKFAQKGELRNESVKDSFMDLAVYALIGLVLYEEEQ